MLVWDDECVNGIGLLCGRDFFKPSLHLPKPPDCGTHFIILSCNQDLISKDSRSPAVHCWHGLVFFLPPHKLACSVRFDHAVLLALISVKWGSNPWNSTAFGASPFIPFSPHPLHLLPSFLLLQLNCKYQVPLFYFVIFVIIIILLFL